MDEYQQHGDQHDDGGVSIADWSPPEERHHATLTRTRKDGTRMKLGFVYRPNRITGEGVHLDLSDEATREGLGISEEEVVDLDDSDVRLLEGAAFFCDVIAEWELKGPLRDRASHEIVPAGQIIPLQPQIVRYVPIETRNAIINYVSELTNPNQKASRGSRRR